MTYSIHIYVSTILPFTGLIELTTEKFLITKLVGWNPAKAWTFFWSKYHFKYDSWRSSLRKNVWQWNSIFSLPPRLIKILARYSFHDGVINWKKLEFGRFGSFYNLFIKSSPADHCNHRIASWHFEVCVHWGSNGATPSWQGRNFWLNSRRRIFCWNLLKEPLKIENFVTRAGFRDCDHDICHA